jgi:pentatricopeptide repeat protein
VHTHSKNHTPNIVFYNTLLSTRATRNDLAGAWQVWKRMKADSIEPNKETFHLLEKNGMGWKVLMDDVRNNEPHNLTTFILRINNARNNGDIAEGKHLLQAMKVIDVRPNTFIYNTLMGMMKSARDMHGCFELFDEMKASGVEPDVVTYNTLMGIKSKGKDVNGCLEIFNEMKAAKVEPDVITYNILMDVRKKQGDEVGCLNILNTMLASNIMPDRYSYNILLGMVADKGDIDAVMQVFHQIKLRLGTPDSAAYDAVLECLAKSGDAEKCKVLLNEMQRVGVKPSVLTLNIILRNFKAPCTLHTMLRHIPKNLETYNIIINTALTGRDFKIAIDHLREMQQNGFKPDAITHGTVVKGIKYARDVMYSGRGNTELENDIAELNDALKQMRSDGVVPDVASYHVLIKEAADNGYLVLCCRRPPHHKYFS